MKFFKKIAILLRSLFPKKLDQNSKEITNSNFVDKKNTIDSKYIIYFKKTLSLFLKYFKKIILFILGLINTMMRPMIKISKKHPIAFWAAVILHLLVLGAMLYKNDTWEPPQQQSSSQDSIPIETMMIDYEIVEAAVEKLKKEEKQKQQKIKIEEKRSETAKKDQKVAEQEALKAKAQKVFAEVKRKAEEAKAKEAEQLASKAVEKVAEAETKVKLEEKKAKEAAAKRIVEEAKTKEAEILAQEVAKQVKKAEEKRKSEEAKAKEAEEKRKLEEEKRKLEEQKVKEAEEKRKLEEEKAKEAEKEKDKAKKLTEEERIKLDELEAERTATQLAFENEQYNRLLTQEVQAEQDLEREARIADQRTILENAWVANIAARVRAMWRYQGAEDDWTAEVYVIQDRDGTVMAVDVRDTNVGNSSKAKAFKDSIERAVKKSSPFPSAPDEAVFQKEILFIFVVN